MAYIMNLYKDPLCTIPQKTVSLGVAGITGYYANIENWQNTGTGVYPMYRTYISNSTPSDRVSGIVLSGGASVFDYQFPTSDFFSDHARSDNKSNSDTTKIYNPFFISANHDVSGTLYSWYISMWAQKEGGNQQHAGTRFQMGRYTENPYGGTRTTWSYSESGSPHINTISNDTYNYQSSQYTCIKIFLLTLGNTKYYMFAYGIMADNTIGKSSSTTMLLLIPQVYFQDQPVAPYVGPVSKESAESAYVGEPAGTDSITSRDLSSLKNPFGFNSGGTMYLSEITAGVYHSIVSGIYDGTSGSPLNALGQVVSGIVGGNTHRPAEEIDAMIKGVLCCHIVPTITTYTTGSPVAIYTISGYQLQNTALAGGAVNQICTAETAAFAVKRINGSFLDFEPYTTVDLVIPFLGTVRIPASVIMDKAVKIRFAIDLLSGTLSADIIISEVGRSWVYTTLQGNCAVDMPVMGAGANANPLLKIASAAGGIATGGTLGAAAGVFNIIDGAASAAFSQPVGKCNLANIGAFLSPRDIALIIHTPSPSNAQDFGVIVGTPSNMSGKVGDFKGYTEFVDVDLDAVHGATDEEKAEIGRILKGGVFL